jgi:hypothetical protein
MVIDVLLAQITSLWAQWMKSMSTGLRGASGEPLFKTKADETPLAESPAEPTTETTADRRGTRRGKGPMTKRVAIGKGKKRKTTTIVEELPEGASGSR